MKKLPALLAFLFTGVFLWSTQPVPYSGKLAVGGVNYHGDANFTFSLHDGNGTTAWRNGQTADSTIQVRIHNGRYTVLLGGQGMNALPPQLFLDNDELYVKVRFDNGDGKGLRHLAPDQRITATPRALVAEVAKNAKSADTAKTADTAQIAETANSVKPGGVTASQIKNNTITTAQLNGQILKYLKPEITVAPQAPGLVFHGQTVTLHSRAEGKYLSYQWYKNGQPITGATGDRYVIDDINKTHHDGNYTLVVSNDFGSVTTQPTQLVVDGTPTSHTVPSISLDMIFCPPGTFTMGSPSNETGRGTDETQHQVTLTNGFYLGKYEVTQAQYETVMTGNSEGLKAKTGSWQNNPNHPVNSVSWNDVQVFLSRLNDMEQTAGRLPTGWKYVLPTEAQWEYACRAGTTTAYSWGNDINYSRANYNWDGGPNDGNDFRQTRDVGQYAANPWGFFDMHGNVWEWVSDWKANYLTGAQTDPEGPASGSDRVRRGGSWNNGGTPLRSAKRIGNTPGYRDYGIGFRLAFQAIPADTANPELELFGGAAITREAGQVWAEPGVEAHDARDGNITDQIVVTGTVDMNSTGTYLLTYTVQDGGGNTATTTRTVTVTGNRTVDLNATLAMDMIWCPPGTFTMGSPTTEAGREADREDEHNVSLTQGFYLGKYEVTQAQYEAVMTGVTDDRNATPSNWHGNPDRPVEMVSWNDAQVFLTRLNEQQAGNLPAGWSYVLPTESQWEYACRAGTNTAYSWGASIASSNANYNWDGGANNGNDFKQTRDVGLYAANPWGLFDIHGNVWEWTADRYQAAYPTGNPVVDPSGPASGSSRVIRGGSWSLDGTRLRSAKRHNYPPGTRASNIGFRVGFQKSQ
jgi:formylglycine-generating enzyme required for sulfatase activity